MQLEQELQNFLPNLANERTFPWTSLSLKMTLGLINVTMYQAMQLERIADLLTGELEQRRRQDELATQDFMRKLEKAK